MASLTQSLLASPDTAGLYLRATRSPFLRLAGEGRLGRRDLAAWLSQDRLYCQALARFLGGLASRVRLPLRVDSGSGSGNGTLDTLEWRILKLLQGALGGMTTELQFFEETARDHELDLAAPVRPGAGAGAESFGPNPTTQAFIDLFDSFGGLAAHSSTAAAGAAPAPARTLLEGLVVLWTTERVYLDAWSYARGQEAPAGADPAADPDGGALRGKFIPNWTSDGFKAFVREIEECLDALAAREDGEGGVDEAGHAGVAAAAHRQVLELEEAFWPVVEE